MNLNFHSSWIPYGDNDDSLFYSGGELDESAQRMVKHEYYGIDEEIDDYLSHIEELEDHREFPKKPFTMDKPVVILTSAICWIGGRYFFCYSESYG